MDNFSQLLEREIPRLRRFALGLHRSDRCRADDLVQDTLVRAIAKQHLWKPGTNLPAWLYTLMHNQHVDDVRRSVSRGGPSYSVEEFHNTLASVNDTSASLQLRDFDRAMAELSIERRETIRLVALEGMSYQAAAELLGVPMGTVRSRIARGRVLLRQMMDAGSSIAPARHAGEHRTAALAA